MLRQHVEGFADLPRAFQAQLARLSLAMGLRHRQHHYFEGMSSISHQELDRIFGRDRKGGSIFTAINEEMKIFEVTSNWSAAKGRTKGYRLTEKTGQLRERYLRPRFDRFERVLRMDGKHLCTVPPPVASQDLDGISDSAWRRAKVSALAPVDLDAMKAGHLFFSEAREAFEIDPDAAAAVFPGLGLKAVEYRLDFLAQLINSAQTEVAGRGRVMHRYVPSASGRLYARGVSLQAAPRDIRRIALHGLHDYDIENCHFEIFSQLAARYGYEAAAIRHYLEHKEAVRHGLASRIGITVKQAKTCLLAVMYGARTSTWHESAIPEEIGEDKAKRLYADPVFAAIEKDIRQGRRVILDRHPKGRTTYMNAMGKRIAFKGKAKANDKQILAHLMQGIEAKALRSVLDLHGENAVVLLHDGFITREPVDTGEIERAILEQTGYSLRLAGGVISMPPEVALFKSANQPQSRANAGFAASLHPVCGS